MNAAAKARVKTRGEKEQEQEAAGPRGQSEPDEALTVALGCQPPSDKINNSNNFPWLCGDIGLIKGGKSGPRQEVGLGRAGAPVAVGQGAGQRDDGDDDDGGEFVLNVDFAPPALQQQQQAANAGNWYWVELSLCVRTSCGPDEEDEADQAARQQEQSHEPLSPSHVRASDTKQPQTSEIISPDTVGRAPTTKRRLVYERLDRIRFSLSMPAKRVSSENEGHAGHHLQRVLGDSGSGANEEAEGQRRAGRQSLANALLRLPLRESRFDACFCFNLLNVRVASAHLLALEQKQLQPTAQARPTATTPSGRIGDQSEADAEEEADFELHWLRSRKTTGELRSAVMHELARVVRPRGE